MNATVKTLAVVGVAGVGMVNTTFEIWPLMGALAVATAAISREVDTEKRHGVNAACGSPVLHALVNNTLTAVFAAISAVPVVRTIWVLTVAAVVVTVVVPDMVPVTARVPAKVNRFAGRLIVMV